MNNSISIIIPTYNEESTIEKILKEIGNISNKLKKWKIKQIIIADGGSTDSTIEKAKKIKITNVKIDILKTKFKRLSKQQSIDMGVNFSKGEIVIFIDADMQIDPKLIPILISPILSGKDISIGIRPRKRITKFSQIHHAFFSRFFNYLFRNIFKLNIKDTQCGFKAFKKSVWLTINNNFVTTGYAFDADFIVKAVKENYKIAKVTIPFKSRYAGYSKLRLTHRIIMILDLFKIALSIKK